MKVEGVLPVDKPEGLSSREAVSHVSAALSAGKAGHCGTLDPMATGVLVVCLGRATLLTRFFAAQGKSYEVEAMLGVETDSYDITGQVVRRAPVPGISRTGLRELLGGFIGEIEQVPPAYSAVKVGGRPLYRYARKGIDVEPRPRRVHIESLELLSLETKGDAVTARMAVSCGPGTYIRSLVHDMGASLGCGATVTSLRRTSSGRFTCGDALTLEEVLEMDHRELEGRVITMESATDWMPTAEVNCEAVPGVRMGRPLGERWVMGPAGRARDAGALRVLDPQGRLLAVYGPERPVDGPEITGRALRVIMPAGPDGGGGPECGEDARAGGRQGAGRPTGAGALDWGVS